MNPAPARPAGCLRLNEAVTVTFVEDGYSLSQALVILVGDKGGSQHVASNPCQQQRLVGLDTEWRPERDRGVVHKTSILQVACEEAVFVFDLLRLSAGLLAGPINDALFTIFTAPHLTKIACDFRHDLVRLQRSYPHMSAFNHVEPYVDLQALQFQLEMHLGLCGAQPGELPFAHSEASAPQKQGEGAGGESERGAGGRAVAGAALAPGKRGLAFMVRHHLHAQLSKAQTCSDWERRPLTRGQLTYAALDAHCQLALYQSLRSQLDAPDQAERRLVVAADSSQETEAQQQKEGLEEEAVLFARWQRNEGGHKRQRLVASGLVVRVSLPVVDIVFGRGPVPEESTVLELRNKCSPELMHLEVSVVLEGGVVRAVPFQGVVGQLSAEQWQWAQSGAQVTVAAQGWPEGGNAADLQIGALVSSPQKEQIPLLQESMTPSSQPRGVQLITCPAPLPQQGRPLRDEFAQGWPRLAKHTWRDDLSVYRGWED